MKIILINSVHISATIFTDANYFFIKEGVSATIRNSGIC